MGGRKTDMVCLVAHGEAEEGNLGAGRGYPDTVAVDGSHDKRAPVDTRGEEDTEERVVELEAFFAPK